MKIDASLLLAPQGVCNETHNRARALLEENGIPLEKSWLSFLIGFLHLPIFWHIEEDGWILGGFGSFSPANTDPFLDKRVFVCKDGFAAPLNLEAYEKSLAQARLQGCTSVSAWLTQWLGENPTVLHYSTPKSILKGDSSPFEGASSYRHFNLVIQPFDNFRAVQEMTSYPLGFSPYTTLSKKSAIVDPTFLWERLKLRDSLLCLAKSQYEETISALKSQLSTEALQAAESLGAPELFLIAWLSQGNQRYRAQALALGGSPLEELLYYHQTPDPAQEELPSAEHQQRLVQLEKLESDIDQGREWMTQASDMASNDPVLRQYAGPINSKVFLKGFRRLAKMAPEARPRLRGNQNTFEPSFNRSELLSLVVLATLEAHHLPQNEQEWQNFSSISAMFFGNMTGEAQRKLSQYSQTLKPLLRRTEKPGFPISSDQIDEIRPLMADPSDWMVMAIAHVLGYPNTEREINTLHKEILSQLEIKHWRAASRALHRYHSEATERFTVANAKLMQPDESGSNTPLWPAVLPERFESRGVQIQALLHPLDLLEEGNDMSHCVGSYTASCFKGTSRIYGLNHHESGERATLELQLSSDGRVFCVQLKGKQNKAPHPSIEKASEDFLAHLSSLGTQDRWPCLPIPQEWQLRLEDTNFNLQVYTWIENNHPSLLQTIRQKLNDVLDPAT